MLGTLLDAEGAVLVLDDVPNHLVNDHFNNAKLLQFMDVSDGALIVVCCLLNGQPNWKSKAESRPGSNSPPSPPRMFSGAKTLTTHYFTPQKSTPIGTSSSKSARLSAFKLLVTLPSIKDICSIMMYFPYDSERHRY